MPTPSRAGRHRALIALNVTLLTLVAIVTFAPFAEGQPAANNRGRGEYTMVGGEITGGTPNAIYVIDANNNEMIALRWNNSRKTLDGLGYRDLAADARAKNQGGPR